MVARTTPTATVEIGKDEKGNPASNYFWHNSFGNFKIVLSMSI